MKSRGGVIWAETMWAREVGFMLNTFEDDYLVDSDSEETSAEKEKLKKLIKADDDDDNDNDQVISAGDSAFLRVSVRKVGSRSQKLRKQGSGGAVVVVTPFFMHVRSLELMGSEEDELSISTFVAMSVPLRD
jgi:hypothetical protein